MSALEREVEVTVMEIDQNEKEERGPKVKV